SDRIELVIEEAGVPLGTISLAHLDLAARQGEYGILIGEPAGRGRGIAARASRLLLEYAFSTLGLWIVVLRLFADNHQGRKLYDRLGFVLAAEHPPPLLKAGVYRKVLGMRLTRANWKGLHKPSVS